MLRAAASRACRRSRPGEALYFKLGGADGGEERDAADKGETIAELAEQHFAGLKTLLDAVRRSGDALSVAPLPEIRRALLATTTISRASRNGRRPAERAKPGRRHEPRARNSRVRCGSGRRAASDPQASAWVSANAGSGKTHVLTQRVLRLLLDGAPPSQILCLTFTKAAAANMAERVFETLAAMDRASTTRRSTKAIVDCGAAAAGPGELDLRAAIVRAHDRDAGRPEDPDDPRLLRAAAAAVPVRGQCPGRISSVARRARSEALLIEARDAAFADPAPRAKRRRRSTCVAREAGADGFDALLAEALSRAETLRRARRRARLRRRARARALGLAPGEDDARASRPRCSMATSGACGASMGARRSTAARASDQNIGGEPPRRERRGRERRLASQALPRRPSSPTTASSRGAKRRLVTKALRASVSRRSRTISPRAGRACAVLRERRRAALTLERSARSVRGRARRS